MRTSIPARAVRAAAALLAAALVALLAVLLAVPAAAAPGGAAPGAAQGDRAFVRLAHLSPDTPQVDVYVDSASDPARSFVVPGVGYGAVSEYRDVAADAYVVSMRPAGAAPDSPAVISTTVDARPGQAYTIAGVGMSAELGLAVLPDDLDAPAEGRADVRVVNAATTAPTVDVALRGQPAWASDVRFGTATEYTEVPVGNWVCEVTPEGGASVRLPVALDATSTYTVLLVDRGDGLTTELIRDSAGSAVVPAGGVATGLGGAAPVPAPVVVALVSGALVLVLLAGAAARRLVRR